MPRPVNAIDFWRGFALVSIFINHIPGIYFSSFTHARYSVSDSADLFVFLAGWSVRLLVESGHDRRMPSRQIVFRLGGRALQIYTVQVFIAMLAIAMLATAALALANPLLLEWNNAAAVFYDPIPTHIGLALITHQLGHFDILPLYVVLMLLAPCIAVAHRIAPQWVLALSAALYCVTLAIPIQMPSWPVEGQWFFNPLAWQLIFVLGFVLAKDDGLGAFARRHIVSIRAVGLPILIGLFIVQWNGWWHDPTKMPQPRLFFILDKTYLTPIRLIQFLSLVAVFSIAFPYINRVVPRLVDFFSMLGRNSLEVFCVGSLLSLASQIVRFVYRGYFSVDLVVVVVGIAIMALTAWLSEWRDRARKPTVASSIPSS